MAAHESECGGLVLQVLTFSYNLQLPFPQDTPEDLVIDSDADPMIGHVDEAGCC